MSKVSEVLKEHGFPEIDLLSPDLKAKVRGIERAWGWLGPLGDVIIRLLVGKALAAAKKGEGQK